MPLTGIDPLTALIVIDLQRGIVDSPLVHSYVVGKRVR